MWVFLFCQTKNSVFNYSFKVQISSFKCCFQINFKIYFRVVIFVFISIRSVPVPFLKQFQRGEGILFMYQIYNFSFFVVGRQNYFYNDIISKGVVGFIPTQEEEFLMTLSQRGGWWVTNLHLSSNLSWDSVKLP